MKHLLILTFSLIFSIGLIAQKETKSTQKKTPKLSALKFRAVGPAFASGRISDLAVNEKIPGEYFVAVASGGVWKTSNWGITYEPIFDQQGSYSIGCLTIDPSNPHTIWVGTGENNNQRSVAYGDGVYKSTDGGKTWKHMGLKNSEHIGMIVVHPKHSNIVYVAAYGSLWKEGGERGVYKSMDGGETWELVLEVDKYTGCNEIHMDPRNPNVLYASFHQRMRKVWTYLGGGPGSGLWKSTDGGKNWFEINQGLPAKKMGRIGLDISPVNPDILYAIVEAQDGKQGVYKSTNRGASWSKQSSYVTSGNYYQEVVCDPHDVNRVFFMDTWLHHTEDGGKTVKKTGEKEKHVDNHAMWIDPNNKHHWLVGCDGGIYETWDAAANWEFKDNLPITQFYKVAVDNRKPFYYIYGGTQDNNSMGGPSQTVNNTGIVNADWFMTNGGDGFESAIDPSNPDIIYAQSQYGWLVRYNKATGERVGIKPQIPEGEKALRWNWDAPLLISPHNHKRLYFCANRVFKSENRGNSWELISPDLSRGIDRNELPIMGRVWGPDAIMKNKSTSMYGNIVAFDESPITEGLLYAGTDDGLIHVKEPNQDSWRKISSFPEVPERTYVNMIVASQHDENTVYAVFNNHKNGDFKPYILKSTNRGQSWTSIHEGLPERGSTYALAEDHERKDLLFVGTEFGVFFKHKDFDTWQALKNGVPTIAVRDIAIQKDEDDLVLGTFGRSFYVLDDYSPLRAMKQAVQEDVILFDIKDALLYVPTNPLGLRGKSHQGASYYAAPNPEFGAEFHYFIKKKPTTVKARRQEAEKDLNKEYKDVKYPSLDSLRAEDREEKPAYVFVIKDANGHEVRRIKKAVGEGLQSVHWNLRLPSPSPINLGKKKRGRYSAADEGPYAKPGKYTVQLFEYHNGGIKALSEAKAFTVKTLDNKTFTKEELEEAYVFYDDVSKLKRSIDGASKLLTESNKRLQYLKKAAINHPNVPFRYLDSIAGIKEELYQLSITMNGDPTKSKRDMETVPSLSNWIGLVVYNNWHNLELPTAAAKEKYAIATKKYEAFIPQLQKQIRAIEAIEKAFDGLNVPYTPGRGDEWKEE